MPGIYSSLTPEYAQWGICLPVHTPGCTMPALSTLSAVGTGARPRAEEALGSVFLVESGCRDFGHSSSSFLLNFRRSDAGRVPR